MTRDTVPSRQDFLLVAVVLFAFYVGQFILDGMAADDAQQTERYEACMTVCGSRGVKIVNRVQCLCGEGYDGESQDDSEQLQWTVEHGASDAGDG